MNWFCRKFHQTQLGSDQLVTEMAESETTNEILYASKMKTRSEDTTRT